MSDAATFPSENSGCDRRHVTERSIPLPHPRRPPTRARHQARGSDRSGPESCSSGGFCLRTGVVVCARYAALSGHCRPRWRCSPLWRSGWRRASGSRSGDPVVRQGLWCQRLRRGCGHLGVCAGAFRLSASGCPVGQPPRRARGAGHRDRHPRGVQPSGRAVGQLRPAARFARRWKRWPRLSRRRKTHVFVAAVRLMTRCRQVIRNPRTWLPVLRASASAYRLGAGVSRRPFTVPMAEPLAVRAETWRG
jgi:hypothetical protein